MPEGVPCAPGLGAHRESEIAPAGSITFGNRTISNWRLLALRPRLATGVLLSV